MANNTDMESSPTVATSRFAKSPMWWWWRVIAPTVFFATGCLILWEGSHGPNPDMADAAMGAVLLWGCAIVGWFGGFGDD